MVRVVGYTYKGVGIGDNVDGDFKWMVKQKKYDKCLFLINENFIDSIDPTPYEGAGTAKLRPLTFRFMDKPRAAGVPTGWSVASGGFTELDPLTKKAIDNSFQRISYLLSKFAYDTIIYSADPKAPTKIGVNIFQLPEKIIDYISSKIASLSQLQHENDLVKLDQHLAYIEKVLTPHARAMRDLARALDRIAVLEKSHQVKRPRLGLTTF